MSTLIETDILDLSITSSLTLQSFLLVALSSGIIAILGRKVLLSRSNQLLTWLACTLILTNPWQWMTFAWEFQTPWFLINTLVLATTLLLISFHRSQYKHSRRLALISIAIITWGSNYQQRPWLCPDSNTILYSVISLPASLPGRIGIKRNRFIWLFCPP